LIFVVSKIHAHVARQTVQVAIGCKTSAHMARDLLTILAFMLHMGFFCVLVHTVPRFGRENRIFHFFIFLASAVLSD
jgi:hypothetical protein